MILRRSRFVHQLPLGENRILIVHAVSHMRLPADGEVNALLDYFADPHSVEDACADLAKRIPYTPDAIKSAIVGLVGAAVIAAGEILGLAVSCRALGIGVEHQFMRHILDEMRKSLPALTGRIIATPRNIPVRNIYRDSGFSETGPGAWRYEFEASGNSLSRSAV